MEIPGQFSTEINIPAVRRRSSGARWRAGRFTMMAASVLLQADSRLAY
jgi:hypothetical protein